MVKSCIFVVEKPLEMSPDLQKFWEKNVKNQPFLKSFDHTTHANFKLGVQYPLSYISMLKSYHFNF